MAEGDLPSVIARKEARGDQHRRPAGPGVVRSLPFEGDETALVAALRAGRADAGAAFYDRYSGAVHALVFRLMGPDVDLDDVVHDVFVRALQSLSRLRDPGALKSWLFGVAARTVMIRFQTRRRQRWLRFFAPEDVPSPSVTPDTELGEALREVYAILDGMDPEERVAFVLHRVEGLSHEDAAAAAGTSLSTYRRRLSRGEKKFFLRARARPALEAWLDEGGER